MPPKGCGGGLIHEIDSLATFGSVEKRDSSSPRAGVRIAPARSARVARLKVSRSLT
jgi:hypothetical protein